MKKVTRKIGDVTIQVKFKDVEYKWDYNRNSYTVTLKNDNGNRTSYTFYDSVNNTQQGNFITEELMNAIVENIQTDYRINETEYPNYYDFAYEFGYERFDKASQEYKQGQKTYKECLKLGNKLKKVISDEWIENLKVVEVLAQ